MTAQNKNQNEPTVSGFMNRNPITAHKNMTLRTASEIMSLYKVGALLVVNDENRYVGIISDKRITRGALAKGIDPATTEIQAVMRKDPISIDCHEPVRNAQAVMKVNGVRYLVVKDGEEIVGILSLSDLIRFYTSFFD